MNIFEAVYKAQFSVLATATRTYLTAVICIAQALIVEVAETTAQGSIYRDDHSRVEGIGQRARHQKIWLTLQSAITGGDSRLMTVTWAISSCPKKRTPSKCGRGVEL